ncbi:MAG: HAD family hydrolase [Deltaproteobacteria bacterium]|nr:MAG: HAD family hydrolase [Deltaproteobacteria bacterium]
MVDVDTIIWDWNGTLLNDVDICIGVINDLLVNRNNQPLDKNRYREIFTFPVKDYYTTAGFDFSKEPFDEIAIEFIEKYLDQLKNAGLFMDVTHVLNTFKENGFTQYMLSAMEHKSLLYSVKENGIYKYFQEISGIHDHFAKSKIEMAKNFINEHNIDNNACCLIGDTLHDYEVAKELKVHCILVANGHQSYERLEDCGCEVVTCLNETLKYFKINHFDIISNSNEENK